MNKVEICNLALGVIGAGTSGMIQDFYPADKSEEARTCTRIFPEAMAQLMREPSIDWAFARSSVALSLSIDTVPGYEYVYAYPANCARLVVLAPPYVDPWRIPPPWRCGGHAVRMRSDGQSRVIASNLPNAVAHYIYDITDPAFIDVLARNALKWSIAVSLSLTLKTSPAMAQNAAQQYQSALSTAAAANGNESDDMGQHVPADIAAYACQNNGDRRGWPYG